MSLTLRARQHCTLLFGFALLLEFRHDCLSHDVSCLLLFNQAFIRAQVAGKSEFTDDLRVKAMSFVASLTRLKKKVSAGVAVCVQRTKKKPVCLCVLDVELKIVLVDSDTFGSSKHTCCPASRAGQLPLGNLTVHPSLFRFFGGGVFFSFFLSVSFCLSYFINLAIFYKSNTKGTNFQNMFYIYQGWDSATDRLISA